MHKIQNVLIAGTGSIGGYLIGLLSTKASDAGLRIIAYASPRSANVIRRKGLRIESKDHSITAHPEVITEIDDTLSVDLVIVATKSTQLTAVLRSVLPLLDKGAALLTTMNGVPWWLANHPKLGGHPLEQLDPEGWLQDVIPLTRTAAAVVDVGCERPDLGHVRHHFGRSLTIGTPEPNHELLARIVGLLASPSLDCEVSDDIRKPLWSKLINNGSMNPISLLTHSTLFEMATCQPGRQVTVQAMTEITRVGNVLGFGPFGDIEERLASRAAFGAFKTSMLQDFEAGRELELNALVGAIVEIANRTNVNVPTLEAILLLSRQLALVTPPKSRNAPQHGAPA
ncbi:2-dehydropantoate 2-reductase [Bradyrhizobium sp. 2]|uniref:ketopantoate reductase family protein n=1 Tax=unclassified Bradyrhizobium TaxID=2631580 RepID=UPI001FFBCAD1|nr:MULTISPECIES: 2-dehydropantoate 2-reductase [unclassified Bradyrhizobium]MCK1447074.1 2-dehydropantoate 2-reductase [Bradyrhizobium sp. 48]MCK1464855.1 2-dehydropantoate 2-reductase [Bradyrhizobium sp. 2]